MTQQARGPRVHERWAHLRFSVIGQLLAAPPPKGELRAAARSACRRASGATPSRASRCASASPPSSAGSTAPEGAQRPGRRLAAQTAHRCRPARRDERRGARRRAGAIRRAQELERPASSRQSRRARRDAARSQPVPSYSTLRRFFKAHGLDKRAARDLAPDRRRRARRGATVRPRGAQLRGRVRGWSVALGLSPRLAQDPHGARRVARPRAVRRPR